MYILRCRQRKWRTLQSLEEKTLRGVRGVASGPPTIQDCFRSGGLCHSEYWRGRSKCPQQSRHQWGWRGKPNLGTHTHSEQLIAWSLEVLLNRLSGQLHTWHCAPLGPLQATKCKLNQMNTTKCSVNWQQSADLYKGYKKIRKSHYIAVAREHSLVPHLTALRTVTLHPVSQIINLGRH